MGVFGAVFGCSGDVGFMLACIRDCRGVIGFNVATLSRLVREKVRPARPDVRVSAKKLALRTKMAQNWCFRACRANIFAEKPLKGLCWARFFAEEPLKGLCRAKFFAEMPLEARCWASFFAIQQS